MTESNADLEPSRFPEVSWAGPDLGAPLEAVYEWVEREAMRTSHWYLREKRWKARWSRGLRACAILFATAGATTPFISTEIDSVGPYWGYILLGVAAGAIALDRFFGFSTSWMRYMAADLAIQDVLRELRFQWARTQVRRAGQALTAEEALAQLEALATAAAAVNNEVQQETLAWVDEFQAHLGEELRTVATAGDHRPSQLVARTLDRQAAGR